MTREEAADFTRKLLARAKTIVFPKTPETINHIPVLYFEAVLSALRSPTPDPDTGLKGCWHCRNIEAHRVEYVIAVRTKDGTPMNTPGDCPYHYCPACGRKLEVEG